MSKSYNRYQEERALKRALKLAMLFFPDSPDVWDEKARKIRKNRKKCSCHMCCNPRRSKLVSCKDKLTIQEKRANETTD